MEPPRPIAPHVDTLQMVLRVILDDPQLGVCPVSTGFFLVSSPVQRCHLVAFQTIDLRQIRQAWRRGDKCVLGGNTTASTALETVRIYLKHCATLPVLNMFVHQMTISEVQDLLRDGTVLVALGVMATLCSASAAANDDIAKLLHRAVTLLEGCSSGNVSDWVAVGRAMDDVYQLIMKEVVAK